jgi:hypothetical protein
MSTSAIWIYQQLTNGFVVSEQPNDLPTGLVLVTEASSAFAARVAVKGNVRISMKVTRLFPSPKSFSS